MKKRNLIIVMMASIFTLIFVLPSAWAGSPRQHQWEESVAIGVGAAVVGSALLNNYFYSYPPTRVAYRYTGPYHHRHYYARPWHRRHWKVRNRWVRNRHCRAWHPRYYHHYGR